MDTFYGFVMRIVALSILRTVLEYILPQGNIKKSAGKVIGLVILLAVVQPVVQLLQNL
ncbi:MAG TPA: stage III sporulation protein AF [Clostridia bacterium]|jgi:stage III sporulation protein AF|nr:stage III sporulation protein AF [Clostridia bacterium]